MKDPGGDSNYPASLTCIQTINPPGLSAGFELVFEDLDTEANQDLVIITDGNSNALTFSGASLPAPVLCSRAYIHGSFQANNNGTVGRGFRLRCGR